MTKLLVAVIGVLVVTTGVLGFVLWDMKSRDAGITVKVNPRALERDEWDQPGYAVRMTAKDMVETKRGKLIALVFTVLYNGAPAPDLRVVPSVPRKNPARFDQTSLLPGGIPMAIPDRSIGLTGTPGTDSKGQVRATLFLPSDGPGSIIPITVVVFDRGKVGQTTPKLGESTKTLRLE